MKKIIIPVISIGTIALLTSVIFIISFSQKASSIIGKYIYKDEVNLHQDINKCISLKDNNTYYDYNMSTEDALKKGCIEEIGFDYCLDENIPTMDARKRAKTSKQSCINEGGKPVIKYSEIKYPLYKQDQVVELLDNSNCKKYFIFHYENGMDYKPEETRQCSWKQAAKTVQLTETVNSKALDYYYEIRDDNNLYHQDANKTAYSVYIKE